ncbi:MAG: metal-dependent hydrolase [Ignavibacteriae bacterium]|nr:metal-dependent hydrolase [Ignavibacteriota bacterium]
MYIGHYAISIALKNKHRQIPLWLLFISVQFLDLLAFVLIILGIEKIHYTGNQNPFYRTVIEYLPYSHSLLFATIFSLATFLIFWKFKNNIWGAVLSIGLLSHWFIDFLFQKSNLPLYFNEYKVGLGLWDFPLFSYFTEIVLVAITGFYLYKNKNTKINRPALLFLILIMSSFFTFITFMPEPLIMQTSPKLKSLMIFLAYLVFTFIAFLIERRDDNNTIMK